MVTPRLALKLIEPYNNNFAESWYNKITRHTNNKLCNGIDLHKAFLIGILNFQYVEMSRALRGLGELIIPRCALF